MFRPIYLKLLWWKKSYPFNWAHKPLCRSYSQDTLQLGRVYLCRSCCCAYLGVAAGLLLLLTSSSFIRHYNWQIVGTLLVMTLPLSHPAIYKKLVRRIRDLLRFFLGMILVLVASLLFSTNFLLALGLFALLYLFWKSYYRKRAKRKLDACYNCPEYSEEEICSGYSLQAASIREYEELATDYLLKTGYRPRGLKQ